MSAGRAELTNVRPAPTFEEGALIGECDECGTELRFWLFPGAVQPTVYEEASIVLRCECGAAHIWTAVAG